MADTEHEDREDHPAGKGSLLKPTDEKGKKRRDQLLIVIGVVGLVLTIIILRRGSGSSSGSSSSPASTTTQPGTTTTTGTVASPYGSAATDTYAEQTYNDTSNALQGFQQWLAQQQLSIESGSGGSGSSSGSAAAPPPASTSGSGTGTSLTTTPVAPTPTPTASGPVYDLISQNVANTVQADIPSGDVYYMASNGPNPGVYEPVTSSAGGGWLAGGIPIGQAGGNASGAPGQGQGFYVKQ